MSMVMSHDIKEDIKLDYRSYYRVDIVDSVNSSENCCLCWMTFQTGVNTNESQISQNLCILTLLFFNQFLKVLKDMSSAMQYPFFSSHLLKLFTLDMWTASSRILIIRSYVEERDQFQKRN